MEFKAECTIIAVLTLTFVLLLTGSMKLVDWSIDNRKYHRACEGYGVPVEKHEIADKVVFLPNNETVRVLNRLTTHCEYLVRFSDGAEVWVRWTKLSDKEDK